MAPSEQYLLGHAAQEEARLNRQTASLALDSDAQLDKIGISAGENVIDLGCGPGGVLDLLGKRVGPTGHVLGIEHDARFAELARRFVADQALPQVEVREGDAYATGLPRRSFDGAHMRLVLVNVPEPERIVREMVSLVRPGGWVASFEPDFLAHGCDPPLPAFERLQRTYANFAVTQGIDLSVGRRTHRLFRDAGVVGIHVDAVVYVYPVGHDRRPVLRDFINNVQQKLIDGGFITRTDLERDLAALESHLANSETLVTGAIFYRLIGRVSLKR